MRESDILLSLGTARDDNRSEGKTRNLLINLKNELNSNVVDMSYV